MNHHTLDALQIPAALIWTDEFAWRPVESKTDYTLTGALIVDVATRLAGRPITLTGAPDRGWVSRAVLLQLQAKAATPGLTMTLTLADGRVYAVMFRPGEEAISAEAVFPLEVPPMDWQYIVTLRLMEI